MTSEVLERPSRPVWHLRFRRVWLAALRRLVPSGIRQLRGRRIRERVEAATNKLLLIANNRVLSGPFAGMRYVPTAHCSQLGPKLLGSYELELDDVIEYATSPRFTSFIDVGAAEGYYVCGLLCRSASLNAVAFEMSESARRALASLAELNHVTDRVTVKGECTPSALSAALSRPSDTFLLVDVEGGERALLDPAAVPALHSVHILVELHEHLDPGVSEVLCARFSSSHDILRIPSKPRGLLPPVPGLSRRELLAAADEARPNAQEWLFIRPKSGAFAVGGDTGRQGRYTGRRASNSHTVMKALPRTSTDKVDYQALKAGG